MEQDLSSVLVFGYGNLARGDDALAPLLIEQLEARFSAARPRYPLRFLSDYQMQIEHVTDIHECCRVLLLDAHADLDRPYQFSPVRPANETRYTTHGMSPATLLHTYQKTYQAEPPPTAMLAIGGYQFDLGQQLSEQARQNLGQALSFCEALLIRDFSYWERQFEAQHEEVTD